MLIFLFFFCSFLLIEIPANTVADSYKGGFVATAYDYFIWSEQINNKNKNNSEQLKHLDKISFAISHCEV